MWHVYSGNTKLTKKPLTEYEAELKMDAWKYLFADLRIVDESKPAEKPELELVK